MDKKFNRYIAVSVISASLGQFLLFFLFRVCDIDAIISNLLSVSISTIPNYLLNRFWVWKITRPHDVRREIFPYWLIAFAGLGLSTLFVFIANQLWSSWYWINVSNIVAYGILWVIKFVILDRYLFNPDIENVKVQQQKM